MQTVSYKAWQKDGFPGLLAGDTILSTKAGHWFTWALVFCQSVVERRAVIWRHAMRYQGKGRVWSQEKVMRDAPLSDWIGQTLRVWHNPAYAPGQRRQLVEQAELKEGRLYDSLGIVGQMARMIPLVGDWLANLIQVSALNYCSEGHCEDERTVTADFCAGRSCQVSPADIDQECRRRGWECWTFKLAA